MLRVFGLACAVAFLAGPSVASAACQPKSVESTIAGIHIGDPNSAVKVIGSRMAKDGPAQEQDKDAAGTDQSFPYVRFANSDGSQELKLFVHYGDVVDSYNEVEVAAVPSGNSKAKRLPVAAFATEHEIKLGMRERDLVKLLGSCFKRVKAGRDAVTLQYVVDTSDHALLKKVNMPSYYAHYRFAAGRLVNFKFGFDYP